MSVRLEWIEARETTPTLHVCEDVLADGQPVSEEFALGLHTMVFEGTRAELIKMLEQALKLVRDPQKWTFIWESDDGPSVTGLYDSKAEAMQGAWKEWAWWDGGSIGGFNTGSFEEFQDFYAESDKIWVVPIGDPS